jgi:hypothetical protein
MIFKFMIFYQHIGGTSSPLKVGQADGVATMDQKSKKPHLWLC